MGSTTDNKPTEGAVQPRVLGAAPEPLKVATGVDWKNGAVLAYKARRDQDNVTRRWLANVLVNKLEEMLGITIPMNTDNPVIEVDGHKFSISEAPRHRRDEPEYYTYFHIICHFCGRENPRLFDSYEQLGALLHQPSGNCQHCNKPL